MEIFPGIDIGIDGAKCKCKGTIKEYMVVNFKNPHNENGGCKLICLECKHEVISHTFIMAYKLFFETYDK